MAERDFPGTLDRYRDLLDLVTAGTFLQVECLAPIRLLVWYLLELLLQEELQLVLSQLLEQDRLPSHSQLRRSHFPPSNQRQSLHRSQGFGGRRSIDEPVDVGRASDGIGRDGLVADGQESAGEGALEFATAADVGGGATTVERRLGRDARYHGGVLMSEDTATAGVVFVARQSDGSRVARQVNDPK